VFEHKPSGTHSSTQHPRCQVSAIGSARTLSPQAGESLPPRWLRAPPSSDRRRNSNPTPGGTIAILFGLALAGWALVLGTLAVISLAVRAVARWL
jgi:hypothetical protein